MTSNDSLSFHILIADSNPVFRLGVRSLLLPQEMFPGVHESGDRTDLSRCLSQNHIDIIVLGIGTSGSSGSEALHWSSTSKYVRHEFPGVRILLIPKCTEIYSLEELMDAGASGYLPLSRIKERLVPAIQQIARGKIYVEEPFGTKVKPQNGSRSSIGRSEGVVPITKRELQILKLIYDEYTNPEIANLLGISRRTVDTHRKNLLRKLNVRNTAGLIRYALRSGYVDL